MNTYTCSICGETYEKGYSDEEAIAEKEQLWGDIPLEECEIVCDDCFKKVMPDEHFFEYIEWILSNS